VFYAWGESLYIFLLIVSIMINYTVARLINWKENATYRYAFLFLGITINLGLLGFYKYVNFIVANVNWLFGKLGIQPFVMDPVYLPLGISFFTFHAISYLFDIYRKIAPAEKNPVTLGLYITMFPQLVAGPIVRFNEVVDQLHHRIVTKDRFANGVRRFIIGLGQKMIIANALAIPADNIFSLPQANLTFTLSWIGIVCYTLQIYFDFAGYSSMAVGLGWMFGFHLPENFNYPYIAKSITEFWRRWHMSLTNFLRDYLYIPLGGNRLGKIRTYVNLVVVFFLCGLWHGASWTFIIWGLYHGFFLVLERLGLAEFIGKLCSPLRHAYVILVIAIGWVFFRSDTAASALDYLLTMAYLKRPDVVLYGIRDLMPVETIVIAMIAIVGSAPIVPLISKSVETMIRKADSKINRPLWFITYSAQMIILVGMMLIVSMKLAEKTHNPFIYFRF
jgi:alginate O-acetyltransferase complex protein AlgI